MLLKPRNDATAQEVAEYVKSWVRIAASEGLTAALALIDLNTKVKWSEALFDDLTYDHFDDGKHCKITDPEIVHGIRVNVYPYNDGTGFAVDHDLAMNGKLSDFTAQFDIRKGQEYMNVVLEDIHVL